MKYFLGESHFGDDRTQNYLAFHPAFKYLKTTANANKVTAWKPKGLSNESIKPSSMSNNSNK